MATLIGVVRQVVGEVFAVASDGTRRPLAEGDRVYAGEQLVTGAAGSIAITLAGGGELTLGRGSSQLLDTQLLAEVPNSNVAQDAAASPAAPSQQELTDVQQLQAAIEAGVDPTQIGEATAAGPGAGGAGGAGGIGGGHSFVLLGETGDVVDPNIGYPTGPIGSEPEFPTADIPAEPAEPVDGTPTIDVVYEDGDGEVSVGPGLVDEAALSFGSDPSSPSESTTGRLVITSPDGIAAVQVQLQNSAGEWIDITSGATVVGQYGFLTFDGAGNWVYNITVNTIDHGNPGAVGAGDQVAETFAVRVVDTDGDISPAAPLTILINDDGPSVAPALGEYSALVVDETNTSVFDTGNFAGAFQANLGADGGVVAYALEINSLDSGLRDVATGAVIELHLVDGTIQG